MAVRGRVAGSVDALKRALKEGTGDYMMTVPADSEVEIRILAEPDRWFYYDEHYLADSEPKFFPCDDQVCIGCDEGANASRKVALPVWDVQQERIQTLKIPKGVADSLTKRYDKWHTLLDRNYTITREGSGKNDTTYEVDPHPPTKLKGMKRWQKEAPAPEDVVSAQVPSLDSDDDDDDFLPPRRKKGSKSSAGKVKRTPPRGRTIRDEDDDEDDEPIIPRPRRTSTTKKATAKKAVSGIKKKPVKKKRL